MPSATAGVVLMDAAQIAVGHIQRDGTDVVDQLLCFFEKSFVSRVNSLDYVTKRCYRSSILQDYASLVGRVSKIGCSSP